ncbi:MAG: DUF1587 domain-containing protein, partial [Planctomycetota bacterium]
IERIQQRIESLKEDDPRLDALDAEIKGFEEQLERQQWIREITDQSSELRELSEFIREISRERSLRSEPVRKRLAELIQDQTQLRRLVEQLDELEQQHDAAPVDQQLQEAEERKIQQVHQSIESIETRLDDGMQIVDALWEFAELLEREEEGDARRGSALKVWKSIQDDLQSAADLQSTDQGRQALDNGRASSSQPHQLQPIKIDASTLTLHRDRNFQRETVPLLRQYCFECHGSDSSLGDLDLEAMVSQEPLVVQRGKWINVIQQIKNRVMPPEDAELPNDQQREQIANVLHREIVLFDYSQEGVRQPGFEPTRRLTHREYDNTVSDLFGSRIEIAGRFPKDLAGVSGFDNSANTLFLQPLLMERYLSAADEIVERLLPTQVKTAQQRVAADLVFFVRPDGQQEDADVAATVLRRFASRAYRREITDTELVRLRARYVTLRGEGRRHHGALVAVIRRILVSPFFLMKFESNPGSVGDYRIDDWQLANRLSYFLWASMPDEELFRLARAG